MTEPPTGAAKPLACDCHIHVYDLERYPLEQASPVSPPHATWAMYQALQSRLGLGRAVIVQPSGYAFDNRCTLEALAAAAGSAKAIVTLRPLPAPRLLTDLERQGVRGVRFLLVPGAPQVMRWADLPAMASRIAPLDWTINLQLDGRELPAVEPMLAALPAKLVIDHVGKFLVPVAETHAGVASLRRLLDSGKVWVKLSAAYETSVTGPPDYADVGRIARLLASQYPERCLWASNWPHPGQSVRPDEERLLALLAEWSGGPDAARRILVDNPAALYRFD